MRYRSWRAVLALVACSWGLVACTSEPVAHIGSTLPKAEIQFVDLQGFDRDLGNSLSNALPKVEVAFYDRIAPSALPERLQHWMAAVESGGGEVKVTQPKSSVTAKSPFLLISAITSIWTASKMAKEMSQDARFRAASGFNADIVLKQDDRGDTVVEKVVFIQRGK